MIFLQIFGSFWLFSPNWYQFLSPLTLWVRTSLRRGVLDTTSCDNVFQWLAAGRWFPPGTPVSSSNKTDCHNIAEILLKVTLKTLNHKPRLLSNKYLVVFHDFLFYNIAEILLMLALNTNQSINLFYFLSKKH